MQFVRFVLLLLVASLAGCLNSEPGAELPSISVEVVDASGRNAYRGDYSDVGESPLRFVPALLDGSLDAVDGVWMVTDEGDFGVHAPLFVDGQLTEAEVFMGVNGAHFWYLEIEIGGEVYHPPNQRFWIATDYGLEPWSRNFTASLFLDEEPACGGPGSFATFSAGSRWSTANWRYGSLYGEWARLEPNPLQTAVIELTFNVQGKAHLLHCTKDGQPASPPMHEVGPGQWRLELNASALENGNLGGLHGEVYIEIFSTDNRNQVTVNLVPRFPQGRAT